MLESYSLDTVVEDGLKYFVTPTGGKFVGVTAILKVIAEFKGLTFSNWKHQRQLKNWRLRVGEEVAEQIRQDSCDRGTEIHQRIANYLRGGKGTQWSDELLPFGHSLKPILLQIKPLEDVKLVEGMVFHPKLRYAGKVDAVARWQGNWSLIEWKTANRLQKKEWVQGHLLQSAAYLAAVNKAYNLNLKQSLIVIAVPGFDAQIFVVEWEELETYFCKWLDCVKLFWALQESVDSQIKEQWKLITVIKPGGTKSFRVSR